MKRNKIALIVLALIIGISVYILDDYIHIKIIRNYLPDFCWAFAFGITISLFSTNLIEIIFIPIICGTFLEICQYNNLILGTGDIYDVLIEVLACLIAILIIRGRNEK